MKRNAKNQVKKKIRKFTADIGSVYCSHASSITRSVSLRIAYVRQPTKAKHNNNKKTHREYVKPYPSVILFEHSFWEALKL